MDLTRTPAEIRQARDRIVAELDEEIRIAKKSLAFNKAETAKGDPRPIQIAARKKTIANAQAKKRRLIAKANELIAILEARADASAE